MILKGKYKNDFNVIDDVLPIYLPWIENIINPIRIINRIIYELNFELLFYKIIFSIKNTISG